MTHATRINPDAWAVTLRQAGIPVTALRTVDKIHDFMTLNAPRHIPVRRTLKR